MPKVNSVFTMILTMKNMFLLTAKKSPQALSIPTRYVCCDILSTMFCTFYSVCPGRLVVALSGSFLLVFNVLFNNVVKCVTSPIASLNAFFRSSMLFSVFVVVVYNAIVTFVYCGTKLT